MRCSPMLKNYIVYMVQIWVSMNALGHVEQSWTSSPLVMCHRPFTARTWHITLDMTMIQPARPIQIQRSVMCNEELNT